MGTLSRWTKYAKARLDAAIGSGNRELDRLEAEREAELADKPWLSDDSDAPSLDTARARIEHEVERQRRGADAGAPTDGGGAPSGSGAPSGTPDPAAQEGPGSAAQPGAGRGSGPSDPSQLAADAQLEQAKLDIEANQREASARLEAMRRELGVEDPPAAP